MSIPLVINVPEESILTMSVNGNPKRPWRRGGGGGRGGISQSRRAPGRGRGSTTRNNAAMATQDYTAYGYAMITPADKLIKMMRQVDREAPNLKPNMFFPRMTPIQLEGD